MIFVIVGSQRFQFNRMLVALDHLIETGAIAEPVFAQIGESDYEPKHFEWAHFLDREAFAQKVSECSLVVTHGGTGAIVGALKKGKPVVAVPRRAQFSEHVDDHQFEIIGQFGDLGMVVPCYQLEELAVKIGEAKKIEMVPYKSNTAQIIADIKTFID